MRPPLLRERDRVRPSSFLAPLPSEERGRGRGGGFTNKRAISPQKPTHTNPGDSERAREGYDARAREVWSPQSRKLPWPRAGRGSGSSPPVTSPLRRGSPDLRRHSSIPRRYACRSAAASIQPVPRANSRPCHCCFLIPPLAETLLLCD